jgi:hypothetical protein
VQENVEFHTLVALNLNTGVLVAVFTVMFPGESRKTEGGVTHMEMFLTVDWFARP